MNIKGFYRTLIYSGLISLVLFTPFVNSENLYNGIINAKQFWFYGAMALLMLAFGIGLLFYRKNFTFSLNIIDISLIVFYLYYLIRAALTPYTPLMYNTRFLNYSLLLIFYFLVKSAVSNASINNEINSLTDVKKKGTIISSTEFLILLLIITGLVQAIWGLLQLYGITRSFNSGFNITGTFVNPAPYALYLAAIFPLALNAALNISETINGNGLRVAEKTLEEQLTLIIRTFTYYISILCVVSIMLVLPATMNRASWLGVIASSLVVLNNRYILTNKVKDYLNTAARRLCAYAIVFLVLGLVGAGLYFLKKGSSDGRLLIWEVTLGKTAQKPLFGYGVGRFEAEYNNWQAEYFKTHSYEMNGPKGLSAGNTKYCFNEYLEMLAELGLIGVLLFWAVIASLIFSLKKKRMSELNNIAYNSSHSLFLNRFIIFFPSLLSLLVCATISFPFYSLPTLIFFFLFLSMISSDLNGIHISKKLLILIDHNRFPKVSRLSTFFTFSTLTILSFSLIIMASQLYKTFLIWGEAEMFYQNRDYAVACKSFSKVSSTLKYNGAYLQHYGKALCLNDEFSKSIPILERAGKYTSDDILYCNLGDSYKSSKMYSKAEEAFQEATYMVPNKFYSQYLLANLFNETGQKEKALRIAEAIVDKRIKVNSSATVEIINHMKEMIRNLKNK